MEILDTEPCNEDLEKRKAIIKLVEEDENYYLIIMSESSKGIREAVNVLTNYEDYSLSGDKFVLNIEEEESEEDKEEQTGVMETDVEDEKQKMIEELSNKISEQKEESEDIKEQEEKIEPEPIAEKTKEPEPTPEKEDSLFRRIISWFLSIFGR